MSATKRRKEKLEAEFDKRLTRYFENQGGSPAAWIRLADDLHEASRLVWGQYREYADRSGSGPSPWLGPTALMLAGMALEDLIKASYVVQHDTKPPATHDIAELLGLPGMVFVGTEKQLIPRLVQFVIWAGRYPAPKLSAKANITIIDSSDWGKFNSVYGRLRKLILEQMKSRREVP